ncbi:IS701 family transposase, partial [Streptomyces sp. NPDC006875]
YRELKHGLGLDHFEGRSWPGWHHHVTLVTAAHAFLTEQRLAPKAPQPAPPSTRPSTLSVRTGRTACRTSGWRSSR